MRINYAEGTCFAVPLRSGGGYGVGVVARARRNGPHILAYLFGPRRESVPRMDELSGLCHGSEVKVARTGDLYLIEGKWPIIGHLPNFQRSDWPFPKFTRSDEFTRRAWLVEYADDDPAREIAATPIAFGSSTLDRDAAMGAGAVELILTKLLGQG